jgi:DnaJ-class molecular chaperone
MDAKALIEDAMRHIRIIRCPRCAGVGETLAGPCPVCGGAGQTITNRLESKA